MKMLSQMKKGIIEYCVLAVIDRGRNPYGYEIVKQLSGLGLVIQEGTIYPLLSRLNRAELVTSEWRDTGHGAPRKYYEITDSGKSTLVQFREEWADFCAAVNRILEEG